MLTMARLISVGLVPRQADTVEKELACLADDSEPRRRLGLSWIWKDEGTRARARVSMSIGGSLVAKEGLELLPKCGRRNRWGLPRRTELGRWVQVVRCGRT